MFRIKTAAYSAIAISALVACSLAPQGARAATVSGASSVLYSGSGTEVNRPTFALTAAGGVKVTEAGPGVTLTSGNCAVSADGKTATCPPPFDGTAPNLVAWLNAGNDSASVNLAPASVSVTMGGAGNDVLTGGPAIDALNGGADDDTLDGGSGTDSLVGGDSEGPGTDTASYATRYFPVNVTLDGVQNDGNPNEDRSLGTYQWDNVGADVENVTGGGNSDTITGDGDGNVLRGGVSTGIDTLNGAGGVDYLHGGGGGDGLNGGSGADYLFGDDGNDGINGDASGSTSPIDGDHIYGGPDSDTLLGWGGSDTIEGGPGGDFMVGGTEGDTLYDVSPEKDSFFDSFTVWGVAFPGSGNDTITSRDGLAEVVDCGTNDTGDAVTADVGPLVFDQVGNCGPG